MKVTNAQTATQKNKPTSQAPSHRDNPPNKSLEITPEIPPDFVTVLRSKGLRMTKLHRAVGGEWETEGYDNAAHFSWECVPITTLQDLYELLHQAQKSSQEAWIRGEPNPGLPAQNVKRQLMNFGESDHQWAMSDLDIVISEIKNLEGAEWNKVRYLLQKPRWHKRAWCDQLAIATWRAAMPPAFHDCSFAWAYSSSAGIKEKLALHFFFMFERPICGPSLKQWLRNPLVFPYFHSPTKTQEERRVPLFDPSTTHTVQLHYVAAPIFLGGRDPVSKRLGFWEGSQAFLPTPPELVDLATYEAQEAEKEAEKRRRKEQQKKLRARAPRELLFLEERVTRSRYEQALRQLREGAGAPGTGSRFDMVSRTSAAAGWGKGSGIPRAQFIADIEEIWSEAGRQSGEGADMAAWAWEKITPLTAGLAEAIPAPRSSEGEGEAGGATGPLYVPGAQLAVPSRDQITSGGLGIIVHDESVLPQPESPFYNLTDAPKIVDLSESSRYIEEIKLKKEIRLLIQEGTTGSGKTRRIIQLLEKLKDRYKSVLILAPLKMLTESLHHRWRRADDLEGGEKLPDAFYYADGKGWIDAPYVISCINSIHRITRTYDLIIIDEVELGFQNLNSRKLMKERMGPAYNHLIQLLQAAKLVAPLDAYLSQETIQQLIKMMGIQPKTEIQINHHEYIHPDTRLHVHPNKGSLYDRIIRDVAWNGKKVYLGATHAGVPELLQKQILKRKPNARILVINRNAPPKARETLKNPNQEWQNYDAVFCSPTASSGVSFDVPDYFDYIAMCADAVPGSFLDGGIGWNLILQMMNRVRNPKSRTFELWLSPRKDLLRPKEELWAEEAQRAHSTIGLLSDYDPSKGLFEPQAQEQFEFFFESRWLNAKRRQCTGGDVLAYFASRGVPGNYEVFFDEQARKKALAERQASGLTLLEKSQMTLAESSQISREQKEKEAELTTQAAEISLEEAIGLLEAQRALEPEERHSAQRTLIQSFLGRPPTAEDSFEFLFIHRKRELQNLAWTSLADEGMFELFELLDLAEVNSGFQSHLQHHTLTALGLAKIWDILCEEMPGFKKLRELWSQGDKITPERLEQLFAGQLKLTPAQNRRITSRIRQLFAKDPALWEPVRRRLSLPRPDLNGEESQMGDQAFTGRVLRGLGFKTVAQEKKEGGKKSRKYQLDLQSISKAVEDATHCRRRALNDYFERAAFAPSKKGLCSAVPPPPFYLSKGGLWDQTNHQVPQGESLIPSISFPQPPDPSKCSASERAEQTSLSGVSPAFLEEWIIEEAARLQFLGLRWEEIMDLLEKKGADFSEDAVIQAVERASFEASAF